MLLNMVVLRSGEVGGYHQLKDFFWELVMLIYCYLIYLNNIEISLSEILKITFRFLIGHWFLVSSKFPKFNL